MKIAVTSFGTEGDVRPYISLASALRARGHDAYVVAAERFEGRARAAGVPFRASGQRWDEAEIDGLMRKVLATSNRMAQSRLLFSSVVDSLRQAIAQVRELTRDAELFVSHNVDLCGYAAALTHRRPRIGCCLGTHTVPSGNTTPWGANLGRPLNRLISALVRSTFARTTDAGFNALLAEAGLPRQTGVALRTTDDALLALIAVSPQLVPPDPRWPARYRETGFWFLDEPKPTVDPALEAFLARHGPPLVVSFGSMVGLDARALTQLLVQGLQPLGRPVVLQAGWAQLGDQPLPDTFFRASYLPHGWLLPRAAALLHHGGVGTVAAAMRAGVPQMVVWHYADQPDWGRRLVKLGLAPATIASRDLSARWLRDHANALLQPDIRARAQAVGALVQAERGAETAAELIEQAAFASR